MKRPLLAILVVIAVVLAACAPSASPTPAKPAASPAPAGTAAPKEAAKAAPGPNVKRVLDRGRLIVGVKYDVPTFGLQNPATNRLEGFDVDLSKVIARELLGSEDKIEFKQAVSKDRIPFLEQGVVDLIASTMTANEERSQQIEFTDVYYVAGQSILVPKNSDITGVSTLKGKRVGTVKGSTSEKNVKDKAPDANVVLFDTYSEAVAAMDSGRLDAVTTDDSILFGYVYQSSDKYKVVGGQFTIEPYAMGIAKGQTDLRDAVNDALRKAVSSGEWAKIFDKNFGPLGLKAPAPPPRDWREVYKMKPSGA